MFSCQRWYGPFLFPSPRFIRAPCSYKNILPVSSLFSSYIPPLRPFLCIQTTPPVSGPPHSPSPTVRPSECCQPSGFGRPMSSSEWYGKYFHIRFQLWLEQMLLKTKSTSSTNQHCIRFEDKGETAPQILEPCVLILLVWETQLKTRCKMGSVRFWLGGQDHWYVWPKKLS